MLFLGLDLAWGRKNTSGGCILSWSPARGGKGAVLDVTETLGDDDEIMAWVNRWDAEAGGEGLLVGVDAPLRVPNQTGKRPCEAEIGRRFAKFQAGAHPANRTIFGSTAHWVKGTVPSWWMRTSFSLRRLSVLRRQW